MMPYTVERRPLEHEHYAGLRRTVRPQEIGQALGETLPATYQRLTELGIPPAGPPVCFYLDHDMAAGVMEILGGCFVDSPVPDDAGLEVGRVAASEVARTEHVGPYHLLGDAHSAVQAWLAERNLSTTAPCWDVFLTDPGEVSDPADYRTEVVWPIVP
jgi:effector-binding domain-containing protein